MVGWLNTTYQFDYIKHFSYMRKVCQTNIILSNIDSRTISKNQPLKNPLECSHYNHESRSISFPYKAHKQNYIGSQSNESMFTCATYLYVPNTRGRQLYILPCLSYNVEIPTMPYLFYYLVRCLWCCSHQSASTTLRRRSKIIA